MYSPLPSIIFFFPPFPPVPPFTGQQKISGRPFLRLVAPGASLQLAFESESDRDEAIDLLRQLSPPDRRQQQQKAAGVATTAAAAAAASGMQLPTPEQRKTLFSSDPDLEILYGQLVVSGVLTEAEFWRGRQAAVARILAGAGGGGGGAQGASASAPSAAARRQRPGLPSVMFRVQKSADDRNVDRVNVTLTPQDIQRIFTERSEVHRAYLAHVPHSMQEVQFWEHFCRLEYRKEARRVRAAAAGRAPELVAGGAGDDEEEEDEIIAPFRRQAARAEAVRRRAALARVDPTVDLAAEMAGEFSSSVGFGSASDPGKDGHDLLPLARRGRGAVQDLFSEVNRHAAAVLRGAPEGLDPQGGDSAVDAASIAARVAAAAAKQAKQESTAAEEIMGDGAPGKDEEAERRWQERAASALEDLTIGERDSVAPLNIQDPRRYFEIGDTEAANPEQSKPARTGTPAAAAAAAAAALSSVDSAHLSDPLIDASSAARAAMQATAGEDAALVAELGPAAAAALGVAPADALGGVMVVGAAAAVVVVIVIVDFIPGF
jgi:hypothetical protein